MDKKMLQKKLQNDPFTEEIVEALTVSDDYNIMICALKRNDCPVSFIINCFMSPNKSLRLLCASHPNTPISVLKTIVAKDKSKDVCAAAKKNLTTRK